jgi:peptidoglycan/LPS O-acetylase OafA/YrhL
VTAGADRIAIAARRSREQSAYATIADRFDDRSNGITALRLILAGIVVVAHAWPVNGLSGELPGLGTFAVVGFFGLSGFLLADSRTRVGPVAFAYRRALRILPGYWVCIAMTSLLVGGAFAAQAWLPFPGVGSLTAPAFGSTPLHVVNSSLWTLWVEIACYATLAILPVWSMRLSAPIYAIALVAVGAVSASNEVVIATAFFVGVTLRTYGATVPLHGAAAAAAGLVFAGSIVVGGVGHVAPIVLPYVVLWAAVVVPLRWTTDLSYGLYIYAFPIAQLVVLAGGSSLWLPVFVAVTLTAGLATAAASWFLVERPALSLKRLVR